MLIQDLRQSERLKKKGLNKVICSIARHMYKPDVCAPPRRAIVHLEKLVDINSSLVMRPVGKKHVLSVRVHPWPSWLTRGSQKVVDFFLNFFYLRDATDFERAPGTCPHC
jgi:hypothetical protein